MIEREELRAVYAEQMLELAGRDSRIVVLDADLMKANGMIPFREAYPERTLDVGVAEANMMGIAAGLSNEGMIPFAHTFTAFATRRSFDQVFISIAYAGLNVKIVGTDPGIAAELNGGTHMSTEDVALMRTVPGMTVVEPVDAASLRALLPQIAELPGPVYLRLFRKQPEHIYEEGSDLKIDKAYTLREGNDASIICSGLLVKPSLDAAELLDKIGIRVRVIHMHTIKPIDVEAVEQAARETGAIVTAENHNVVNGLGSAVADTVAEHCPVPVRKIGLQDEFGEVGYRPYLEKRFHLTPQDIAEAVTETVQRKK